MKTIIVNGKYLSEPAYRGSGFHSYLKELVRAWARGCHNRYLILLPEKNTVEATHGTGLLSSAQATKLYLSGTNTSQVTFATIPKKHKRFEDDLADSAVLDRFQPDFCLFPHLELPRRPLNIPVVTVIHDIIPTLFLAPRYLLTGKTPAKMMTGKGISDYFYLKKHIPRIRHLITISETTRKSLLSVLGKNIDDKISVIPPAAGEGFVSFSPNNSNHHSNHLLKKYNLRPKKFAVYFGGYTVRKNYNRLLRAYDQASRKYQDQPGDEIRDNIPLVMVGGERRNLRGDKAVFLPKLPEEDLLTLISQAAFSIYPSIFEGFGLPILESIALGTLPLASDIPSSREILGDVSEIFFDPYDTDSLAQTILRFLSHPEKISLNYVKIKDRFKNYSWEISGQKFDSLFSGITE